MTYTSSIHEIRLLIARDEILEAIKRVFDLSDQGNGDWLNEAIVLSMEWHSLQKAIVFGRINWLEEQAAKRLIAYRLAKFLDVIVAHGETPLQAKVCNAEKKILKCA